MKILVISLLRLGDVVMSTGILRLLREKYRDAEIHLLINQQFAGLAPMIKSADHILTFDRQHIQEGLGDASRPLFDSYERVRQFVEDLSEQQYDLVINLTQNKLSGYLLSLVEAKEKQGLSLDVQGRAGFGSSWFRHLNRQIDSDSDGVFHHTDIFNFALGSGSDTYGPILAETESGLQEAQRFIVDGRPFVAIQALSSDIKKDWELDSLKKALRSFQRVHPKVDLVFLAAPNEAARLGPLVMELAEGKNHVRLAVCGLEAAFSLVARAKVLLTMDTSIKHLASATSTPVLELSLGSSDYRRTGVYSQDSIIIQSKEPCAPCSHSKNCHRERHFCGERLSPELIALTLSSVYTRQLAQLSAVAEEFSDEADVLRTELREGGFWSALPVQSEFSEASVARLVDLCTWKIFLNQAGRTPERVSQYGAESVRLSRLLRRQFPTVSRTEWKHLLSAMEKQIEGLEGRFMAIDSGLKSLHAQFENADRLKEFVYNLVNLRDRLRPSPMARLLGTGLDAVIDDDQSPAFVRLRRITETMTEIQSRAEIEKKVVRALGQLMEAQ